jgi:hypothetical protein
MHLHFVLAALFGFVSKSVTNYLLDAFQTLVGKGCERDSPSGGMPILQGRSGYMDK